MGDRIVCPGWVAGGGSGKEGEPGYGPAPAKMRLMKIAKHLSQDSQLKHNTLILYINFLLL